MTSHQTTAEAPEQPLASVVQLPTRLSQLTPDQIALAGLMLGSLGVLAALRKGMKGIGPIELTGSTISGVEFAAMLMLVGSGIRLIQIYTSEKPIGRALAFVY